MRTQTRPLSTIAAVALLGTGLGVAAPSAHAAPTTPAGKVNTSVVTVATGLNNPRHLSFNGGGDLFVAEAGLGGSGPCSDGPEGNVCLGSTGSVTRVAARSGAQSRVVTGLASVAGPGGVSAAGPTDVVAVANQWYAVSMGLGNTPAARATFGPAGAELGTIIGGAFGGRHIVLADIAAAEGRQDWDGAGPDSNPGGIELVGNRLAVADAGANTLLSLDLRRGIRPVATFPTRMVPTPPFLPPGTMPMQAVPTSVVKGPDGAWYSSELTGFPFPTGGSRIMRTVPGQAPTVYATGLTNVTDLAWHRGSLYAVQISDEGLLTTPASAVGGGSLVRVSAGATAPTTVVDNLTSPYGVAFRRDAAYITTCAVCAGAGTVVRAQVR